MMNDELLVTYFKSKTDNSYFAPQKPATKKTLNPNLAPRIS